MHDDERADFWRPYGLDDLAERTAILHRMLRERQIQAAEHDIMTARRVIADLFIRGHGIEVGAGSRPFPIPEGATCFYGDIRDGDALKAHFKTDQVTKVDFIDAQTFAGIPPKSLDFIISAHVIEHVENPVGSLRSAMARLKPDGVYVLAVPDARYAFDRQRPLTTTDHLMADDVDGGAGTRLQSYREFVEFTAVAEWKQQIAEETIEAEARRLSEAKMDIHFHVWTGETFLAFLDRFKRAINFEIVGTTFVVYENLFILRSRQ